MAIPKPTALKWIDKTSHQKLNAEEPTPTVLIPDRPDYLSQRAITIYDKLAAILVKVRLLTEADYIQLGQLSQHYARLIDAELELEGQPLTLVSARNGYPYPNPLLQIINNETKTVDRLCKSFGLDPSSRSKLKAESELNDSDVDMGLFR